MGKPTMMGVTNTIPLHDVQAMTPYEQDVFLKEVATDLERKLREFVGDARPRSEVVYKVTGPHQDPLQGTIWTHTMAAHFDPDDLSTTCDAYRVYVQPTAPTT